MGVKGKDAYIVLYSLAYTNTRRSNHTLKKYDTFELIPISLSTAEIAWGKTGIGFPMPAISEISLRYPDDMIAKKRKTSIKLWHLLEYIASDYLILLAFKYIGNCIW